MAVESSRGCGHRKVGGLYLVSDGLGEMCERLPFAIVPCPTCNAKVRQTRGWSWQERDALLLGAKACRREPPHCPCCPACNPTMLPERVGLMWVGEKHYPTPGDWAEEAARLGVSKRVSAIPKDFELGRDWCFVAHPKTVEVEVLPEAARSLFPEGELAPGVFHVFQPSRVELIVTPSMREEEWVEKLVKRGVVLVEVPEDDPDHAAPQTKRSARKQAAEDHAARLEERKDWDNGED